MTKVIEELKGIDEEIEEILRAEEEMEEMKELLPLMKRVKEQLTELNRAADKVLSAPWLIWSNEHAAWWGPGERGYTTVIEEAGRYTREEAEAIVRNANAYLPAEQDTVNEVMVRAPED